MDTSRDGASQAQQVARNDAAFREANEEIRGAARRFKMDGLLPVLCECADLGCIEVVLLTHEEYERVRAGPRRFLTAPGHEVHAEPWARVVARRDRYVVVEKIEEAGKTAERLDPRGGESS